MSKTKDEPEVGPEIEPVDPNADVFNPRMLTFPQDPTGYLYKFKSVALSTIEQQNGNEEKHRQFMETIVVLAKFAQRRFSIQKQARDADVAAAEEAIAKLQEPAQEPADAPKPSTDAS